MALEHLKLKALNDYKKRTNKSFSLYRKSKSVMPAGNTRSVTHHPPYPITMEYGKGPYLYDIDGNKYIDIVNNYTSMIHGHAHPAINKSIQEALAKGINFASLLDEQVELSEVLTKRIPSMDYIRYCNSGTEAAMIAVRAARAFKKKPGIIKMIGGYHGSFDDVDTAVDHLTSGRQLIEKGIPDRVREDVYLAPFNNAEAVEEILRANSEEIGCIIVEPVMGASGVIEAKQGYLAALRKLANQYDVLLIFDEVQTFRLDYGGAQAKYGVTPDITILGKVIGGGLPIGAFGGRADIMEQFIPESSNYIYHSGTFNGNLLAMAAGKVSVTLLDSPTIDRLNTMGETLQLGIEKLISEYDITATVTRAGSLMNIHFTQNAPNDYESAMAVNDKLRTLFHIMMLNKGVFIAPRGLINLSTALNDEHIQTIISSISEVFAEWKLSVKQII